jgi:cobalamin synthase
LGATDVRVGAGGLITVNVTVLLAPAAVVTLTFRVVRPAVGLMLNVAVTMVALTTVRLLTVIPPPDTLMAVAPVRFVPVRVTGTLVPLAPSLGTIVLSVGRLLLWNSIAPASTAPLVFLALPKKSVFGASVKFAVPLGM